MAFNKDANWDTLEGQDLPSFNLESAMHQKPLGKNKIKRGLQNTMNQAKDDRRSFDLRSPNKSMKQGGK